MESQTLIRPDGSALSYVVTGEPGMGPTIVFLHGLWSDKGSIKGTYLGEVCAREGIRCIRFDAWGHGDSAGTRDDFTIRHAVMDALQVVDQLTQGPVIFIGSSMGGWVALRVMEERPERICGVIGIATAPDFTKKLENLSKKQRIEHGYPDLLIETGKNDFVLDEKWEFSGPVHLIQGKLDESVDWHTPQAIAAKLPVENVTISLINEGDHRLNRPEDLAIQEEAMLKMHSFCVKNKIAC